MAKLCMHTYMWSPVCKLVSTVTLSSWDLNMGSPKARVLRVSALVPTYHDSGPANLTKVTASYSKLPFTMLHAPDRC